jgi:catechol-2,3-dioxygenase
MLFEIPRTNIILYCRKWLAMTEFYGRVLGLPVQHQNDWFIEYQIREGCYLSVANAERATIQSAAGQGITLSWQVADVALAREQLRQQQVDVTDIKEKWGALVCYLHDPEGNRIELWQSQGQT